MAFTTTPYLTLADAKNAISTLDSNSDDAFLNLLIVRAQGVIDNYCGYPFQQDGTSLSPATRYFNGNGGLILPIEHCQSITQVLETEYNITAGFGEPFQSSTTVQDITLDIVLLPLNDPFGYMIQRITGCGFEQGLKNYQINGVWGYASVPVDVTLAAAFLVAHYYGLRDTYYADALTQGTQTMRYSKQIPIHVREILDRYRANYFTAGNFVS